MKHTTITIDDSPRSRLIGKITTADITVEEFHDLLKEHLTDTYLGRPVTDVTKKQMRVDLSEIVELILKLPHHEVNEDIQDYFLEVLTGITIQVNGEYVPIYPKDKSDEGEDNKCG